MYQTVLLDHYQHPRHKGELLNADFNSLAHNPSCGDSVLFQGIIDKTGTLTSIAFQGTGCVISQATTSLLCEHVLGKTIEHIQTLNKKNILELIRIELGPTRLKCALLSLEALHQGLTFYINKKQI